MAQGFLTFTEIVGAAGTATVTIRTKSSESWVIGQVSNEMPGAPATALCTVRKNGYVVSPLIPQSDTADGAPAIEITPADVMTVEWTLCTPGLVGKVAIYFDRQGIGR